jgi:hypothetical protein
MSEEFQKFLVLWHQPVQVEHPLSKILGTGSVSGFGFFRILEYLHIIMG